MRKLVRVQKKAKEKILFLCPNRFFGLLFESFFPGLLLGSLIGLLFVSNRFFRGSL